MTQKRLIYIAKSKIPSRHANSVQVVNMICAFSSLVPNLEVYLPGGLSRIFKSIVGTLFNDYGHSLPKNMKINFKRESSKNKYSFEDKVLKSIIPQKETLSFTRSPYIAWNLLQQKRPVIFESHWFSRDAEEIPINKFSMLVSESHQSSVVATCPAIASSYIQAGLDPSRILTLPNSVDVDAFSTSSGGGLKKLFGSRIYDLPIFIYTGSLGQGKGAQFLAEAASTLSNIHVAIIGGSIEEINQLRMSHGNHPGLFLHPAVQHKDIPGILKDATALVMPYQNEGTLIPYMCPLKMFEYLATGKPVISADLPALRTVLRHNHNALLFEPGSTASLKEQIHRILAISEDQSQAFKREQLSTVARFSWIGRAKTILDWHGKFENTSQENQA
jgi:glycosyltransferase involved in cell wall biosynthesis